MGADLGSADRSSINCRRNGFYRFCGIAMILCMVWVGVAMHFESSIFWAEALALEFFALSWLMKGHADQSLDHAQLVFRKLSGGR